MTLIPERTVGRLSLYRRLLERQKGSAEGFVYSHELARMACVTPAQVRRDLMAIGYSGSTKRGYRVSDLVESVGRVLDGSDVQRAALVGVGNLGRAILAYFSGRRPGLRIDAAFDSDPRKTGRVIGGCRCHGIEEMDGVVAEQGIVVGIVCVPADAAQATADLLVKAGVRGILNFAPVPLRVPDSVYLENRDMTTSLEKVAYFARMGGEDGDDER